MTPPAHSESQYPREATVEERRWIARLKRTLDAMPSTLRGFHAPGGISFFDRDDMDPHDGSAVDRQKGEIDSISSPALGRIDAGDW